jgi:hypothetical protein
MKKVNEEALIIKNQIKDRIETSGILMIDEVELQKNGDYE